MIGAVRAWNILRMQNFNGVKGLKRVVAMSVSGWFPGV